VKKSVAGQSEAWAAEAPPGDEMSNAHWRSANTAAECHLKKM